MSAACCVYVIGGQSGPQKIGISADPAKRARIVQSHSPEGVLLHHKVLPDGDARLVERVAHQLLQAKRLRGEWFDVEIAEAVAAIEQAIALVEVGDLSILGPLSAAGRWQRGTKTQITFTVAPAVVDQLDAVCERMHVSRSALMTMWLMERLEREAA